MRRFDSLGAAGVSITATPAVASDEAFICRRGEHKVTIWICHDLQRPGMDFITVPYPPWSWRPWRWRGDSALFDQICAAFEANLENGLDRRST